MYSPALVIPHQSAAEDGTTGSKQTRKNQRHGGL
jgi:hypothetical protein